MNLEGYANLFHWVEELNRQIENVLLQRSLDIIQYWCTEFECSGADIRRDVAAETVDHRLGDGQFREDNVRAESSFIWH